MLVTKEYFRTAAMALPDGQPFDRQEFFYVTRVEPTTERRSPDGGSSTSGWRAIRTCWLILRMVTMRIGFELYNPGNDRWTLTAII